MLTNCAFVRRYVGKETVEENVLTESCKDMVVLENGCKDIAMESMCRGG